MPNSRALAQLRSLIPYAAKILPVLTGVAVGELPVHRPDLSALNRHFGEMQNESRGLRSSMEGQSEQIGRVQEEMERLSSAIESSRQEQQELAKAFRSLAGLLKGFLLAILLLLVATTALSVVILLHISHS